MHHNKFAANKAQLRKQNCATIESRNHFSLNGIVIQSVPRNFTETFIAQIRNQLY